MATRDTPESRPAADEASAGSGLQQQPPTPNQPVGSDDELHPDEHGTSEEGGYREQDYGGESTHLPTERKGRRHSLWLASIATVRITNVGCPRAIRHTLLTGYLHPAPVLDMA